MTPPPSSQAAEPTQVDDAVWSKRAQLVVRRRTRDLLAVDPHFKAMKPRARRLMRVLIVWHDPATGHLMIRTKNATLVDMLECSETTLRRARHEAIDAGFIAGYAPGDGGRGTGDGGWAGRYTISRTPEEAAEARALRQAPDAPYWPAVPERHRLGTPLLEERRGRPKADEEKPAGKPRRPAAPAAPRADVSKGAAKRVDEVLDGTGSRYDPATPEQVATSTRHAAEARADLERKKALRKQQQQAS